MVCSVSGVAILIFDIILTLDVEVKLIWNEKGTLSKFAYLINRYAMCAMSLYYVSSEQDIEHWF